MLSAALSAAAFFAGIRAAAKTVMAAIRADSPAPGATGQRAVRSEFCQHDVGERIQLTEIGICQANGSCREEHAGQQTGRYCGAGQKSAFI